MATARYAYSINTVQGLALVQRSVQIWFHPDLERRWVGLPGVVGVAPGKGRYFCIGFIVW